MVRIKSEAYGTAVGKRYGKWLVVGPPFSIGHKRWSVVAMCNCGQQSVIEASNLSAGKSKGCMSCQKTKHGDASNEGRARLYKIWVGIKKRCMNANYQKYADYGGRGIGICGEWQWSYEAFRDWSLANGYSDSLAIDRRDNDGSYEPGNCRWVSRKVNQRNRRTTRLITAFGECKCMAEWAEDSRCVVSRGTFYSRISNEWSPEAALSTPIRKVLA